MAKKLNDYIAEKGMKKYELARELGTTEANVSRWLNGKHKISKAWQELIKQRLKFNE
ncbi:MAG: helix-turn-helix transcriptional regulator [Candidatus Omnitrophica bacterium]|nr:helix-turn-helix transcriptional regulator [Candidatus Omnitrophota bacterium]